MGSRIKGARRFEGSRIRINGARRFKEAQEGSRMLKEKWFQKV